MRHHLVKVASNMFSVDRLAAMNSLKRIYLSSTGITPTGLKRLRAARADLVINGDAAARAHE